MWRLVVVFLVVIPAAALTGLVVALRYWTREPLNRLRMSDKERAERQQLEESVRHLNEREGQGPGPRDS